MPSRQGDFLQLLVFGRFRLFFGTREARIVNPRERLLIENSDAGPEVEAGAQNRLGGVVRSHVFVGDRLEVLVDTQAGRVTVETSGAGAMVQPDDAVSLIWSPSDTLVFARPAS